nr:immunoglobulin light chain junction region [Macaca mulatta]
CQHGYNTPYSF